LTSGEALLEEVFEFAREQEDSFLLVNSSSVLARLHIARHDCARAAQATMAYETSKGSVLYAEYLGIRALVLAALGRRDEAHAAISAFPERTNHAEAQAFALLSGLILAETDRDRPETVRQAIAQIQVLGQFDPFITACRAHPDLVDLVIRSGNRDFVAEMLDRSNDADLAKRYGIGIRQIEVPATAALSRREAQVLDLVANGHTNEEVAGLLFISPVTVKAHLRHIYDKLGVRNRVEAVTRFQKDQDVRAKTRQAQGGGPDGP
jgi:ATP/maltotriose-dependent transcriptional regulator MalT